MPECPYWSPGGRACWLADGDAAIFPDPERGQCCQNCGRQLDRLAEDLGVLVEIPSRAGR